MQWLNAWNDAMRYMEEHLDDNIDLERAAQIACCSVFHFHRMFSYMAEVPLSEYIRRRRMTKAAVLLQQGDQKVIDIALRFGYDSPTAFNRAFQAIHGVSPSAARNPGITLKAYPPITFKITIKGEAEMNYRIESKPEFRVVGAKRHFSGSMEEGFASVPLFWQEVAQRGVITQLCELIDKSPSGVLGVSYSMDNSNFDYYIAVATDKKVPQGMDEYIVPACTWAIFECVGAMPDAIQNLQKRIVTEWLPSSGYEYANAPDIELYFEGNQQAPDYKCEVWLPVKKA